MNESYGMIMFVNYSIGNDSDKHITCPSFLELLVSQELIKQSQPLGGDPPIQVELIVASGLRFLGGQEAAAIGEIFCFSQQSAHHITNMFLDACMVEKTKIPIKLPMPNNNYKIDNVASGFANLSENSHLFNGCIGAIDGWLCNIEKPTETNAADYYSGHYCIHGLNVLSIFFCLN